MQEQAIYTLTKSHVLLAKRELCITWSFVPSALFLEPHDISIRSQHADPKDILCLYFTTPPTQLANRLQYIHIYTLDFHWKLNVVCLFFCHELRLRNPENTETVDEETRLCTWGKKKRKEGGRRKTLHFLKYDNLVRIELMSDSGSAPTPLESFLKRNNIQKRH